MAHRHSGIAAASFFMACLGAAALGLPAAAGADPYADAVVSYGAGSDPVPGYMVASTALGAPERFSGEGIFPAVVSIFSAPWLTSEIVSIGAGGSLTVRFDEPVADDPANPWGIDLLVFTNAFFIAGGGGIDGLFADEAIVEVSPDGVRWQAITPAAAGGVFPTQGYSDSGPFDAQPGSVPTDFTRPVNPAWSADDFLGLGYAEALSIYGTSGGGVPFDIAGSGFDAITRVRISNVTRGVPVEIDALVDVAPATPGDTNLDGMVDVDDLVNVVVQWGPIAPGTTADLNADGAVDVDDLVIVIVSWGGGRGFQI